MLSLRKVAGDHAFLTHRTNHQALAFHRFPRPVQLLSATARGLQRTVEQRSVELQPDDLALTIDWTHLDVICDMLHSVQAADTLELPQPLSLQACLDTPIFQCAHCDFCTESVSAFRRHCTVAHQQTMTRTNHVDLSTYATDGLPTCKYCHQHFTTWRMFEVHVQRGLPGIASWPCSVHFGATSHW